MILSIIASSANAWKIDTGDFKAWSKSIVAVPAVGQQIHLYFNTKEPEADKVQVASYASTLPALMKERIFSEATKAMGDADTKLASCKSFNRVDFPKKLFANSPAVAVAFEKETLRFESLACLGQKNLDQVFNVFSSDDFQKQAIKGLKSYSSDQSNNQICRATKLFIIGTSANCYKQQIYRNENTIVIHSYNESNQEGVDAPFYFRESIMIVKRLENNDIALYNLGYARGPKLPPEFLVKTFASKQYAETMEKLASLL